MLPTEVKNERGRCGRCGRTFNLTRNGTMRKHKCSAAAPLATSSNDNEAEQGAGKGGSSSSLMVWENVGLCLTRIWRDGMSAAFVTSVSTSCGLKGLALDSSGKVTSTCAELENVGRGCVLVGIGDRVLQQPPLEPLPAQANATEWLRDRLGAYGEVGWDRVPVLCHGPVPVALRQRLEEIQQKEQWSRNDTMLIQMTLMTVTDRELASFDAAFKAEERRAAEANRAKTLSHWRSSLLPLPFSSDEDEIGGVEEEGQQTIYANEPLVPWLVSGGLFLDTLCALRTTAKSVAKFLSTRVKELAAPNFRRDRLDPTTMIARRPLEDFAALRRQAQDYARQFKDADRFYDFVSSRFAGVHSLELPILPGTTEIGVRQIAFALGPRLRVLKLTRWSHDDDIEKVVFNDEKCLLAGGEGGALDVLTTECDNLTELVVHSPSGAPHLPPAPRAWFEQRLGCLRVLDVGNIAFDAPLRVSELPRLVELRVAHLPDLVGSSAKRSGPTSLHIYGATYLESAIRDWALAAVSTPFANDLATFSVVVAAENIKKRLNSVSLSPSSPSSIPGEEEEREDDDGDATIRAICTAFPRIRNLSLRRSRTILRPKAAVELRRLQHLERLDLADSPLLDSGCLPHLPPQLTMINLSGCVSLLSSTGLDNLNGPYGRVPAPSVASSRFAADLIAPLRRACPRAHIKAHIEPSCNFVLCAEFREQAASPTEVVCPRCFWRINKLKNATLPSNSQISNGRYYNFDTTTVNSTAQALPYHPRQSPTFAPHLR